MRIVISSPPKMGNRWIKCLLSRVYDLKWINGDDSPNTNFRRFRQFVNEGRFPDGTIFHQHCQYKPKMCDVIENVPAHLVTIVRDPYDAFVSMYHWIQSRTDFDRERGHTRAKERPRNVMVDKAIDDPAILDFLAGPYGEHLRRAEEWIHSGRAVVVRYEELHKDPVGHLTHVTSQIEPVSQDRIEQAIAACSVDNMRQMGRRMSRHVRTATVGDSKGKLSEAHLKIFRERYGDLVSSMGYEIR